MIREVVNWILSVYTIEVVYNSRRTHNVIHPGSGQVIISSVGKRDVRVCITPVEVKVLHKALKDHTIRTGFCKINIEVASDDDMIVRLGHKKSFQLGSGFSVCGIRLDITIICGQVDIDDQKRSSMPTGRVFKLKEKCTKTSWACFLCRTLVRQNCYWPCCTTEGPEAESIDLASWGAEAEFRAAEASCGWRDEPGGEVSLGWRLPLWGWSGGRSALRKSFLWVGNSLRFLHFDRSSLLSQSLSSVISIAATCRAFPHVADFPRCLLPRLGASTKCRGLPRGDGPSGPQYPRTMARPRKRSGPAAEIFCTGGNSRCRNFYSLPLYLIVTKNRVDDYAVMRRGLRVLATKSSSIWAAGQIPQGMLWW